MVVNVKYYLFYEKNYFVTTINEVLRTITASIHNSAIFNCKIANLICRKNILFCDLVLTLVSVSRSTRHALQLGANVKLH